MTNRSPLTGGCLCGAVRYSIAAAPLMAGHCACDNCRHGTGAEHASLFAVPADAASTAGKTSRYVHKADSGNTVTRHFCPTCGAHTRSENSGMAQMRMFTIGTLDDVARVQPGLFVYHAKKAPWDTAGHGLQTFEAMAPVVG